LTKLYTVCFKTNLKVVLLAKNLVMIKIMKQDGICFEVQPAWEREGLHLW